jgi:hypothetical protein
MPDNRTRLLTTIDSLKFNNSLNELLANDQLFKSHYRLGSRPYYTGPLRECRTCYIAVDDSLRDKLKLIQDPILFFQLDSNLKETEKFINSIKRYIDPTSSKTLGRAYITMLPPGKKIYKHDDNDESSPYWNKIDRYQFYYTGSTDVVQTIGNINFPALPGYLYLFDHKKEHEYENNSNENLILLVFDLLNIEK